MDHGALIIGLFIGMSIGAVSMHSLWITVNWLPNAQRPFVVLAASASIRLIGALLGFYLLAQSGPLALFGGLIGIVAARTIAISRVRSRTLASPQPTGIDAR